MSAGGLWRFRPLSSFQDDKGSTTLSVVVAIVLVITVTVMAVQIHWIHSSSADVQTIADLGALAGANIICKVVMVAQLLDAILLSLNLVGLMLHLLVVVAGVLSVVASVLSLGSAAGFLAKAMDWLVKADDKFMKVRADVVDAFQQFMDAVNTAAPYLAMANSYVVVARNSGSGLGSSSGSPLLAAGTYQGIAVPIEFTGVLEGEDARRAARKEAADRTDAGASPDDLKKSGEQIGDKDNEARAAREGMEEAEKEGWQADAWNSRNAQVPLEGWDFGVGKQDFKDWLTSAYRTALDVGAAYEGVEAYRATVEKVDSEVYGRIDSWADFDHTLSSFYSEEVWYAAESGEEVYHAADCRVVKDVILEANLRTMTVREALAAGWRPHKGNQSCKPTDGRALDAFRSAWGDLPGYWDKELAAHDKYEASKRAAEEAESDRDESLEKRMDQLFDEAMAKLLGDRLSYMPPGSQGFFCAVVRIDEVGMPAYTMPGLTGNRDARVSQLVAVSAARILPAQDDRTLSNLMDGMSSRAKSGEGWLAFLGMLGAGAGDLIFTIWDACLNFYITGVEALRSMVEQYLGSPLGGWASDKIGSALEKLKIGPPDLRSPQPVLVNTYYVYDDMGDAGGLVNDLKKLDDETAGFSLAGLRSMLRDYVSVELDKLTTLPAITVSVEIADLGTIDLDIPLPQRVQDQFDEMTGPLKDWALGVFDAIPVD